MDKKTLYLECYSGISGDMTVAALIDLGADTTVLLDGLKSLHVDGYKIEISRKFKNSIEACDFNVILDKDNHDHDLNYLFSHEQEKNTGLTRDYHNNSDAQTPHDNHTHNSLHTKEERTISRGTLRAQGKLTLKKTDKHTHSDNHPHIHYGMHEHRNLKDINEIIDAAKITLHAKNIAKKIFYIIAGAEAKAHGKSLEEVHFHEVGAVDSIVDIVAVAICLDNLNISEVIVSELYEGCGQITCQHGVLPVPVPAVVNIATAYSLPLKITNVKGELVTPTGAAIVAAIKTKDSLPKEFKIQKLGLGLGKRNYEQTSFLRGMIIEETSTTNTTKKDFIWVLEANIDDCTGEALSMAMEKLFENGAKDVYYTPIYMKKNRPAYLLGVLCTEDKLEKMEELIFINTTTIGIRKYLSERTILSRDIQNIQTAIGDALIKVCTYQNKTFYYPEFESVKSLMKKNNMDYQTVYSILQNACSPN